VAFLVCIIHTKRNSMGDKMNKEKLLDVIAGIFSIFFIAIVFYLYFNQAFYGTGYFDKPYDFDEIITYEQTEHNSCHINIIEPTIVLRIDDVRAYSVPTPYLVNEIIDRNLAVTLGVIPHNLEKDDNILKYLISIREDPNIEIAQHGTLHDKSDIDMNERSLLEGTINLQNILGVRPVTYIIPYNEITEKTREIVSKYFKIISGKQDILKEGEEIAEIGYTVETYYYSENQEVSIDYIIEKCKSSLNEKNLCVIEIHPQEYSTDINNPKYLSEDKFNEFKEMLDRLQELDAKFSTFNDLVTCAEW